MLITNIHQAKTHLSKLIEQVVKGKEIIIGKAGKPIARLVPYVSEKRPRKLGQLKDKIWVADNFDEDLPSDILDSFYGESR